MAVKRGQIQDAYKQSQGADPVLNFATGKTSQAIVPFHFFDNEDEKSYQVIKVIWW